MDWLKERSGQLLGPLDVTIEFHSGVVGPRCRPEKESRGILCTRSRSREKSRNTCMKDALQTVSAQGVTAWSSKERLPGRSRGRTTTTFVDERTEQGRLLEPGRDVVVIKSHSPREIKVGLLVRRPTTMYGTHILSGDNGAQDRTKYVHTPMYCIVPLLQKLGLQGSM